MITYSGEMTKRVHETVYRVRWMRKSWAQPRSEVFLSLHSAEKRLEKLRESWHGSSGPNPLAWTQLESSRVTWEGGEMDRWPYAYHPPVAKRKGPGKNLKSVPTTPVRSMCQHCGRLVTEVEPGIWKAGDYSVCPPSPTTRHEPS